MNMRGTGSVTRGLARSLLAGVTLLWLAGVLGSGFVLKGVIDRSSDHELEESGAVLMSLATYTDDLVFAMAILGPALAEPEQRGAAPRYAFVIRDASGGVLLKSRNATPELERVPLRAGLVDAGEWRVATLVDPVRKRFLHMADPLAERSAELMTAMLGLMVPLAALLAFVTYIVFRASRSLVQQVQRTANAVSEQDPQSLQFLPLSGVVTEMRPAVEATNRLLARLAEALETERTFTYNSAHELRTPIAGALAQAQLVASMADTTALREHAEALVQALTRLARLAERLLALARAEGAAPLTTQAVDLRAITVVIAREFQREAHARGCRIEIDGHPASVRGDIDAIGLAMRNLVENALAYAGRGASVQLACGSVAGHAYIAVRDDGPGVAPEELGALVKRFARGRNARGTGAGLGLAIVETLARRMGAKLVLRSPPPGARSGFEARIEWLREPARGTRGLATASGGAI